MSNPVISNSTPRRSRKRHKPIARVTSYDYNVQYDLRRKMETMNNRSGSEGLFATPVHAEAYNVMEGEILVSIDKSAAYRDAGIHCFSFANGLGGFIPDGMKTQISNGSKYAKVLARYIILSKLQLVGVAVTNFNAEDNSHQSMMQGFVSTFGGLDTIVNTGDEPVRAGDFISVDLPPSFKFESDPYSKYKKQEGIPLDKLLFATKRYDGGAAGVAVYELIEAVAQYTGSTTDLQGQSIPKIIQELAKKRADEQTTRGVPPTDPVDVVDLMHDGLQEQSELVLEVDFLKRRFLLGKALSGARPGEPFDLVLSGSASC